MSFKATTTRVLAASPGLQHHSCKGCNALKLGLQNVKLEVEQLKRQIAYSNKPTTIGQPSASSKPHHAEMNRLQESNNSLIDTVQVLANLISKQSCQRKDPLSTKESQEKITIETVADHSDSSSQQNDIPWETAKPKSNKNKKRIKKPERGARPQGVHVSEKLQPRAPSADERPVTLILGDSMLKFVNGNRLSKQLEKKVYVRSLPGARVASVGRMKS